jgi:hypothetical protein
LYLSQSSPQACGYSQHLVHVSERAAIISTLSKQGAGLLFRVSDCLYSDVVCLESLAFDCGKSIDFDLLPQGMTIVRLCRGISSHQWLDVAAFSGNGHWSLRVHVSRQYHMIQIDQFAKPL